MKISTMLTTYSLVNISKTTSPAAHSMLANVYSSTVALLLHSIIPDMVLYSASAPFYFHKLILLLLFLLHKLVIYSSGIKLSWLSCCKLFSE